MFLKNTPSSGVMILINHNDLEKFERELHSLFATAEAEVVGHEVNRFDVDRPFVTVNGVVHHQVLRCEDTYFCASGPVIVNDFETPRSCI